ncbi:hypothetical protein AMECASPLE_038191 [Ameca splendens]|uniref:Uncharacterized protein n=1 Tax=Ameca splendens TaxID=208324 RepID=A0ABV1A3J0_9TELE
MLEQTTSYTGYPALLYTSAIDNYLPSPLGNTRPCPASCVSKRRRAACRAERWTCAGPAYLFSPPRQIEPCPADRPANHPEQANQWQTFTRYVFYGHHQAPGGCLQFNC